MGRLAYVINRKHVVSPGGYSGHWTYAIFALHHSNLYRLGRLSSCHFDAFRDALGHGRSWGLHRHLVSLHALHILSTQGRADVNVVATVVTDESGQVLDGAGARVLDGLALLASLEQLDSRETLDLVWNVVQGGVNLGDNNLVGVVLVETGQLLVLGSQSLAVSAPWGVELEENVLVAVDDEFLVVLRHDDSDWAVLLLWDGLALDASLDLAGKVFVDEFADVLLAQILLAALLFVWELLVLGDVLNSECRELSDLEVEVACVLAEGLRVDGGEVDGALVLFSDGLERLAERCSLLLGLGEDVGERDASLELPSVLIELLKIQLHLPPCSQRMSLDRPRPQVGSRRC